MAFDPQRPLVFVHIVKTAGTSLISAVSEALGSAPDSLGFDRMLFGPFFDFASIPEAQRKVIHLSPDSVARGPGPFHAGHMSLSTLREVFPDGQFITILREPVARVMSHWLYWRAFSDAELSPWGTLWGDRVRISRKPLAQFLSAPEIAAQTDNLCLRTLLWPHPLIPDDGFIKPEHDAELLEAAYSRIRLLDFVDLVENPQLEDRISMWLGRKLIFPRLNVVRAPPLALRSNFSSEILDASERLFLRSRLDLTVWREACRLASIPSVEQLHLKSVLEGLARVERLLTGSQQT